MAEAKDIAEQVTALSFAALSLALPGADALAPVAISLATLAAMGGSLRRNAPEATAQRAVEAALDGMVRAGEFDLGCADRALALLGSGERAVRLSPPSLIAASREADFEGTLAAQLADSAVGAEEPEMRGPLLVAFRASLSVLRKDEGLRAALTVELLLQAARDNGAQLDLLADIQKELLDLRTSYGSLAAALDDVRRLSRADKLALAGQFERADAAKLTDAELMGFLENKAEEWRVYRGRIEVIDERTPGLGNLKAAAREAAARLDLEEVEALLARVDEVETEIAAETKVLRAENALLRGRMEEAERFLSAAADGFTSVDPVAPALRRIAYAIPLYEHGLRYGGEGLPAAVRMWRRALDGLTEAAHPVDWATTQNNLGNALLAQGERLGGEAGAALLGEAVAAYRAALRALTEVAHPVDWAGTQNNLGAALQTQGARLGGEAGAALLGEAVAAYRAALRVWTEAAHSVQRAATHNNLGAALQAQGLRLGGEAQAALLGEAVAAYRAALLVRTEAAHPVGWAATQNNLGIALAAQGARLGGEAGAALLGEAVAAYRAALRVWTEVAHPVDRAKTMENLGVAHAALAENETCTGPCGELAEALAYFEAALRLFDPDHMPYNHAKAAAALARVRAALAARDCA